MLLPLLLAYQTCASMSNTLELLSTQRAIYTFCRVLTAGAKRFLSHSTGKKETPFSGHRIKSLLYAPFFSLPFQFAFVKAENLFINQPSCRGYFLKWLLPIIHDLQKIKEFSRQMSHQTHAFLSSWGHHLLDYFSYSSHSLLILKLK